MIKDVVCTELCDVYEVMLSFDLPKEEIKTIISNYSDSMNLSSEQKSMLLEKIDVYGLSPEEAKKIQERLNQTHEQNKQSSSWFGTLNRVSSMFMGSGEKTKVRSNSNEHSEEDKESTKHDFKSPEVKGTSNSSFITPMKGESNSDFSLRESSGGSIDHSHEYEKTKLHDDLTGIATQDGKYNDYMS